MSKKTLKILSFVSLGISSLSLIIGMIFHFGRTQQVDLNLYNLSVTMGILCLILAIVFLVGFLVLYFLTSKKKN